MAPSDWIAIVAIVAGLLGTVFTQMWQSYQERRRAEGTRWLEERRHAYTALLEAVDSATGELGSSCFMASTHDYTSFRHMEPIDESAATAAASALELIAPKGVREHAAIVVATIRELDWSLATLRAGADDDQISGALPALSDSLDALRTSRDDLAYAMRRDVRR
ncbi:hypothetical protein [Cellulosimicrobium sp. JZ28]|uniref:hypothetical protein n=1 Tax=Cellulosimicrobium sp. JZ28 TaxID=1906273 RepID=UPI00188CCAC1|nr:hypothetical protein [Cellulosimicrobium sp. JZ28]